MKTLRMTLAVAGLFLAGPLIAQSVQATVPFSFYVGNTALPAGSYVVRPVMHNVLAIQNAETKATAVTIMPVGVQAASPQNTKLVFHRYGNTYFLSQVWQGLGRSEGFQLVPSKGEREIATKVAVAVKSGKADVAAIPFRRK